MVTHITMLNLKMPGWVNFKPLKMGQFKSAIDTFTTPESLSCLNFDNRRSFNYFTSPLVRSEVYLDKSLKTTEVSGTVLLLFIDSTGKRFRFFSHIFLTVM